MDLPINGWLHLCRDGMKDNQRESFVWTVTNQFHVMPRIGGSFASFIPAAMSHNGAIVVGQSQQQDEPIAMIWGSPTKSDPSVLKGFVTVKELLARHGRAKQVEGYRFSADAVSADGRSMAGRGTNPKGEPITWFITIPSQPSTGTNRDTIVGLVADRLSQASIQPCFKSVG